MNVSTMPTINIKLLGLNHVSSTTAQREVVRSSFKKKLEELKELSIETNSEFVFIETCNRFEVLFVENSSLFSSCIKDIFIETLGNNFYELSQEDAISHLYHLAVGLDSMILGEAQILGQLKSIYRSSCLNDQNCPGHIGSYIHRIFQDTFRVAKLIRTKTGIGRGTNSVAYAGIEQAKRIFGDLTGLNVLIIGAGETAELGIKIFKSEEVSALYIANRTIDRASVLAEKYGAFALGLSEVPRVLKLVDVVFIAIDLVINETGDHFKLHTQDVNLAVNCRDYKIQCYIDISTPRILPSNIDTVEGAFSFDIDSLGQIVNSYISSRLVEAEKAKILIQEEVNHIFTWMRSRTALMQVVQIKDEMYNIINNDSSNAIYARKRISKFFHDIFRSVRSQGKLSSINKELISNMFTKIVN